MLKRHVRIDEKYLAFVRLRPCIFCGGGNADAHHLVHRGWKEPFRDDLTAIPCDRKCHSELHSVGLPRMLERHGMTERELVVGVVNLLVDYFTRTEVSIDAAF